MTDNVKLAPHCVEAEEAVIGSILIEPKCLADAAKLVKPDDFFIVKNGWVFSAILALRERGAAIDFVTVCDELKSRGKLDELGGSAYIQHIESGTPSALHALDYARIVAEKARRRELLGLMSDGATWAYDEGTDPGKIYGRLREGIDRIIPGDSGCNPDRFTIHWAAEALQPQPPIDWIVEGLLSAGSVAIIAGEGGTKKTWALLDLAVCVAMGQSWLGFPTCPGLVLIVDEESGEHRLKRRLGDVLRGHEAGDKTAVGYISLAGLNMTDSRDIEQLRAAIVGTGARLVIIDALVDILGGADENSASDIAPIFHALRSIAEEAQACIVTIDHTNRLGDYRGSSAKKGACDLLLLVVADKQSSHVQFKTEKARDIEPVEFAGNANFFVSSFYMTPTQTAAKAEHYSKSESYVLRYLEAHGQSPMADIENHADACTIVAAKRAVYSLVKRGKVARVDSGGPGEKAEYNLTESKTSDTCEM